MAITLNTVTVARSISTGTVNTVSSSVGNLMIVCCNISVGIVSSITDNQNNTYISSGPRSVNLTSSARTLEIWYAPAATSGIVSITVNFTGGSTAAFAFYDCSGADINNPLAAYSTDMVPQPSAATAPAPTVNVPTGGGIVICINSSDCNAISSSFILDNSPNEGFAHYVYAAAGSYAPTWTMTGTVDTTNLTAAFKSTSEVPLLVKHITSWMNTNPFTPGGAFYSAGNLLVALIIGAPETAVVSGITDNATGGTNTWLQVPNAQGTAPGQGGATDIWYVKNSKAGATTITIAYSSGALQSIDVCEITGADTNVPLDASNEVSNQPGGNVGPPYLEQGAAITTNYNREILLSVMLYDSTAPCFQAPFNSSSGVTGTFPSYFGVSCFQVVTNTGMYSSVGLSGFSGTGDGENFCNSIASFILSGEATQPSIAAINQGYAAAVQDDMHWLGGDNE